MLATWYEDRALHDVGHIRMQEWWAPRSAAPLSTGAALTFWVTLENGFEVVKGPTTLPDAIEAGMRSTVLGEFEHVFCMCYPQVQTLNNMPDNITLVDATAIMDFEDFQMLLASQTPNLRGFVAVLAEWLKLVGALRLPQLADYSAVVTFDCDTLWQRKALPSKLVCGHFAGTLGQNPVSRLNRDMGKRLCGLTYNYAREPRDYLVTATPLRFPRGSPALRSLVMRILPLVVGGRWLGGNSFDQIMNIIADTFNNWGLRASYQDEDVFTPVPYYAWDQPLKDNSAAHHRWGITAIRNNVNIIGVNALWQTSKMDFGPSARDSASWKETSLVRLLVNETMERVAAKELQDEPLMMGRLLAALNLDQPPATAFTVLLQHGLVFLTDALKADVLVQAHCLEQSIRRNISLGAYGGLVVGPVSGRWRARLPPTLPPTHPLVAPFACPGKRLQTDRFAHLAGTRYHNMRKFA